MKTKSELVNSIYSEFDGITKGDITKVLTALSHVVAAEMAKPGDIVILPDIGRFKLTPRAERKGRNPATGEEITIPAQNKVKFMPAKYLVDAINEHHH
jgi:DNA-binding protein HU-beta